MTQATPAATQSTPASTEATPASTGDIRRLTDEERWAILNSNTEEKAAAARGELPGSSLAPGIHGEVGVMIGSHGTRSVYGTAAIPLGDNAGAVVSFESSRFGYPR